MNKNEAKNIREFISNVKAGKLRVAKEALANAVKIKHDTRYNEIDENLD